jgi:hypothetical protein
LKLVSICKKCAKIAGVKDNPSNSLSCSARVGLLVDAPELIHREKKRDELIGAWPACGKSECILLS